MNNEKTKTLVLMSNSFGYGPTSTLLAILNEIEKKWKGEILLVLDKENKYLTKDGNVKIVILDDRNEGIIEKFLKKIDNPYIFSCMNRFCIEPAKKNNIPIVFLDLLSWFWKEIPQTYLKVDYYFYQKIPFTKEIYAVKKAKNAYGFNAVIGKIDNESLPMNGDVLISIGGGYNPLTKSISKNYLELLAELLIGINYKSAIKVIGGEESVSYLRKRVKNKNIVPKTLSWQDWIAAIKSSKILLTNGGLKGTVEALFLRKQLSFILPLNKSQWKLIKQIKKYCPEVKVMMWEDYFTFSVNLDLLTEKETILYFESLAKQLLKDKGKLEKARKNFRSFILNPGTNISLFYKNDLRFDGASKIASKLIQIWGLN